MLLPTLPALLMTATGLIITGLGWLHERGAQYEGRGEASITPTTGRLHSVSGRTFTAGNLMPDYSAYDFARGELGYTVSLIWQITAQDEHGAFTGICNGFNKNVWVSLEDARAEVERHRAEHGQSGYDPPSDGAIRVACARLKYLEAHPMPVWLIREPGWQGLSPETDLLNAAQGGIRVIRRLPNQPPPPLPTRTLAERHANLRRGTIGCGFASLIPVIPVLGILISCQF